MDRLLYAGEQEYFFSIQPFWEAQRLRKQMRSDHISVAEFSWERENMPCVPGNGQIGIVLTGPEQFSGYCFGVADRREDIPLHGMHKGYFIRFSPGTFSHVCKIPAAEIAAEGVELRLLFSGEKLGQLRDAVAATEPILALLQLLEGWASNGKKSEREQELAYQAAHLIWRSRGTVRIRELEQETLYSARRLQEVVARQVGVGPKQLCRQTRFQNALHLLRQGGDWSNQAQVAQLLGYSDQAHYNREFKAFCGLCPSQYQKLG